MDEIFSEPPPKRPRPDIPELPPLEKDEEVLPDRPPTPRPFHMDYIIPHAIDIRPPLSHANDLKSIPTTSRAIMAFTVQHKLRKTHTDSECREDRYMRTFLPFLNARFLLPVINWHDNSCFFDSLILAAFGYSIAFDFLMARSIASATALAEGRRAVRDDLRALITQIRTDTGVPGKIVKDANASTRVSLNRQHLPLPITQQFGIEGACSAMGDPSQLWNAIVSDIFESPLRAYCFKRSVYDRGAEGSVEIVKPLSSFSVIVSAFDDDAYSRDVGNAVLQAWRGGINDSDLRTPENSGVYNPEILQAPHALVIEIGRLRKPLDNPNGAAIVSKNRVVLPQTLELTHREKTVRYVLRSLVCYLPQHYISCIRGPTLDDWVFVDALPGTHATTQVALTGDWSAIVLDPKAEESSRVDVLAKLDTQRAKQRVSSQIVDPWKTATMAFYEEEEFEELSHALLMKENNPAMRLKSVGLLYDAETSAKLPVFSTIQTEVSWKALYGTYVEEAIGRIRSSYRKTEPFRVSDKEPGFKIIRTLRPSRNYLANTRSTALPDNLPMAIPPMQGRTLSGPIDLLYILFIVRAEALDNLLAYTPPLVAEIERSYRKIWHEKEKNLLVPYSLVNVNRLAAVLQGSLALPSVFEATVKWIEDELASLNPTHQPEPLHTLARAIRVRRRFINDFINTARTSYFYPAQECYDSGTSTEKRKLLWDPFTPVEDKEIPLTIPRMALGMNIETKADEKTGVVPEPPVQTTEMAIGTLEKLSGVIPRDSSNLALWIPLENSFCVLSRESHPQLDDKTFVPKLVKVFTPQITTDGILTAMLKIARDTRGDPKTGGGAVALFPFTFFVLIAEPQTVTSIQEELNFGMAFKKTPTENDGVRICTHGQEPIYSLSAVLVAEPTGNISKPIWSLLYKFAGSANTWYLHDTKGTVTRVDPKFNTLRTEKNPPVGVHYVRNPFALLYEANDFDPPGKYKFY